MKKNIQTTFICFVLALSLTSTAQAAFVSASISNDILSVGETTQISLYLNLNAEEASVFEGAFDLTGLNNIVSASLTAGGPSWQSSFGNIVDNRALLSLTSNNDGRSQRLVASLDIQALNPGTFEVLFDSNTFAAFDINVNPFIQDLVLTNINGEVLTRARVVPIPPAIILFLSGLGGFSMLSRRRKSMSVINNSQL